MNTFGFNGLGLQQQKLGDLTTLTTTEKTNLVGAINEVDADLDAYKDTTNIKVATIDKELSNVKNIIADVNVNQESTQDAEGLGIISLPVVAGDGSAKANIKGMTLNNSVENGDFSDGTTGWASTSLTINVISGVASLLAKSVGGRLYAPAVNKSVGKYFIYALVKATSSLVGLVFPFGGFLVSHSGGGNYELLSAFYNLTSPIISGNVQYIRDGSLSDWANIDVDYIGEINMTALGIEDYTEAQMLALVQSGYFDGLQSANGVKRVKSVSEDTNNVSYQYLQALDGGEVAKLRRLPNGTIDEIVDGELVKRVSDGVAVTGVVAVNVTNYPLAKTGGYFINDITGAGIETGIIGTNSTSATGTLYYELATPITTPIETSGNLISYPSGTVYVDDVVADASVYTTKFDIGNTNIPISSVDVLIKYDFDTGVQTVLDATSCVIAGDGLSFTHTGLTDGDMAFVDYFYDIESVQSENTITYYDSRYVVADSVNSKYYTWKITSASGVPTVALTEVV